MKTNKKPIFCLAMLGAMFLSCKVQVAMAHEAMAQHLAQSQMPNQVQNQALQDSTAKVKPADSKTYTARFEKFVNDVAACDTLSKERKEEVVNTYKDFLAEYKVVRDSLSDEDVRICSKAKVKYQKAQARIFVNHTSDNVADTAEGVGNSVSKFFKKTKKKVQGAIEGFKEN